MAKSTTGSLYPEVDMTNWRVQMQKSRIKFDDKRKAKFLKHLLKHGKKVLACRHVDIAHPTYKDHIEADPDFAANVETVLEERAARIVNTLETEAMDGYEEPVYGKDGKHVGTRPRKETQLRAMVLKRHDPEYKDRQDVNVNHQGGGVLVVPAEVSMEDFLKEGEALRDKMLSDKGEEPK